MHAGVSVIEPARCFLHTTLRATTAVIATAIASAAFAADFPVAADSACVREFRANETRSHADMRDLDRLIVLLREEIDDPAVASGNLVFRDDLRARLLLAEGRRTSLVDSRHADRSNAQRDCGPFRDAERDEAMAEPASTSAAQEGAS